MVESEGDFPISVKCDNPLDDIGWHPALAHNFVECCRVDLVKRSLDIVCEYCWPCQFLVGCLLPTDRVRDGGYCS